MAGRKSINNTAVVVACLVALIQISSSAATSHTVGDSTGWIVPTSSSIYTTWASKNTFKVGDDLVFTFTTGHTVAEVSKAEYDACSSSKPISIETTGPATVTISTAGAHYYICTISGHCSGGQKLAITATAASSTTSPSPSTTTTSPPPSNSSAAVAGAGLVLPFVLVAAAFML